MPLIYLLSPKYEKYKRDMRIELSDVEDPGQQPGGRGSGTIIFMSLPLPALYYLGISSSWDNLG